MEQFIAATLVITAIFAVCFGGMSIGLIIRGRKMRGGCGSSNHNDEVDGEHPEGEEGDEGCGLCPKKKINICKSENDEDMNEVSKLATLGRYE